MPSVSDRSAAQRRGRIFSYAAYVKILGEGIE
jgi:hypothetical protein